MSTALKCPNPSCPYLFDPSRVPAGAVLTCPRCGMRFTLGPAAPATTASSPPQAQFPASPAPAASGFEGMEKKYSDPETGPLRDFSAAGQAAGYQTGIIAFVCFALLAGAAIAVYMKVTSQPEQPRIESGQQLENHNLVFEPPGEPWAMDPDVKAKFGPPSILAFKRPEPDAFFVLASKSFDDAEPLPSELRATAYTMVDRNFAGNEKTQLDGMNFLGLPAAVAFKFRGDDKDGKKVEGLCYAVGHKGLGYWMISWAGERDAEGQVAAFDAIREKLKLGKARETWSPSAVPVRTFGGHAVQYQLLDGEKAWKEPEMKERPPGGEDPNGDLLLIAKAKAPGQEAPAECTLVTILLDSAGGDALAQGRKYVEDKYAALVKQADDKLVARFAERSGAPDGDPPSNLVETPTPVVRLQMTVQGASNFSKLVVVSAAKIGDRVVVVHGACGWADRELFEGKLMQIAGSLRESK